MAIFFDIISNIFCLCLSYDIPVLVEFTSPKAFQVNSYGFSLRAIVIYSNLPENCIQELFVKCDIYNIFIRCTASQ